MVKQLTRVLEVLISNLGSHTGYYNLSFRGCPPPLQANFVVLPRIGHYLFLPNPLRFIVYLSSNHSKLCGKATDSVSSDAQEVRLYVQSSPQEPWKERESAVPAYRARKPVTSADPNRISPRTPPYYRSASETPPLHHFSSQKIVIPKYQGK